VTRFGYATGSPPVAQPREPRVAQPTLSGILLGAVTVAAFVFAASAVLTGCTPAGGTSVADGGGGGGPADHPAPPPHCFSALVCDGDRVRACDHGVMGQVVENCGAGETCSEARCTSTACASVERTESASGCLFYGALIDNIDHDDVLPSTVIVTNQTSDEATASLQMRDGGPSWRTIQSVHIPQSGADRFAIPRDKEPSGPPGGVGPHRGFRIVSDRPLTAAFIESDDATEMALSTGGTMLLPHHALGNEYMVMTYPQQTLPTLSAAIGSREGASQVMVVATVDHTVVTVRLTKGATLSAGGGIPATAPGDSFTVPLNDGDTLQFFSRDEGTDLSGTMVNSDQPVAVLSGNIYTTYGLSAPGINSPDMALEQLLPVRSWSQIYVAARLGPQNNTCDTLFMGGAALWLIAAALDDTRVTFEGPPGMVGLPAGEMILGRGEVRQIIVGTLGSFLIKGSKPIMAMQGMDCEATLSSGVSTEALWRELRFALPANFDHELMVVRRDDGPVRLDSNLISDSEFQPVGGRFQVARIPMPPCVGQPRNCLHTLEGTFGLTLRGMDVLCGYALTVPTWAHCSPFTTPDCIP
jgi:hypothetical protein